MYYRRLCLHPYTKHFVLNNIVYVLPGVCLHPYTKHFVLNNIVYVLPASMFTSVY